MVVRTIRINESEADLIHAGKKRFVFRSDKDVFHIGDFIHFMVYKHKKPMTDRGEEKSYVVTGTYDHGTAPLEKGFQIVAFREA